jgi:hypothetical protein
MRLNLVNQKRVYSDTGPYKSLTEADLQLLRDEDTIVSSITVTAETLAIICDLGARYRLEELVYFRDAATTENVTFYGKQGDSGFDWEEIVSTAEADRITIDFTEVVGHFEQLKVIHTVTAGTADVYELEVWTDDGHILFGAAGEITTLSVDAGTETLYPEAVQVYNPQTVSADYYCAVDPYTTNAEGLLLGATTSGPFYGIYGVGVSLPVDVPWVSGSLHNVTEVSGTLTLVTGTYGYYYTPVIDIDTVTGRRLFWQATTTGTTSIDDPSRDDSVYTVQVRFSDTTPTDGGWTSGQMSVDLNWSVVSGTVPFEPYDNNHILNLAYKRYFQAKIELLAPEGATPALEKFGIEQALMVAVPPMSYQNIYAKSTYSEHVSGRTSGIIVWSPEHRNIGQ